MEESNASSFSSIEYLWKKLWAKQSVKVKAWIIWVLA